MFSVTRQTSFTCLLNLFIIWVGHTHFILKVKVKTTWLWISTHLKSSVLTRESVKVRHESH